MTADPTKPAPGVGAHETGLCGAKRRDGGTCQRHPMAGQRRCRIHGGASPAAKAAAARRIAEAQAAAAVVTYGLPVDVHPLDALRAELARTNGAVLWLEAQIRALDPEALIWGTTEVKHVGSGKHPGIDTTEAAAVHGWMEHYRWERKHLADVSATAVKVGIDLLEQKRIEAQAAEFVPVLRRVAEALGADPDAPETTRLILAALQPGAGALAVTA